MSKITNVPAAKNAPAAAKNTTVKSTATSAYTKVQEKIISDMAKAKEGGFLSNDDVKALVLDDQFSGKNAAMIRGKVSSMKLYKAAAASAKPTATEGAKRKLDFVSALEILMDVPVGAFASFEKAAKPQLELAVQKLIAKSDAAETK